MYISTEYFICCRHAGPAGFNTLLLRTQTDISGQHSHWCSTSQNSATVGSCEAGGFVNSAVTVLFTKTKTASWNTLQRPFHPSPHSWPMENLSIPQELESTRQISEGMRLATFMNSAVIDLIKSFWTAYDLSYSCMCDLKMKQSTSWQPVS